MGSVRKTARIWRRSFVGLEKAGRLGDGWSEIAGRGDDDGDEPSGGAGEGEEDFLGSAMMMVMIMEWEEMGNGKWEMGNGWKWGWWRRVYMKRELVVGCTMDWFELVFSFNKIIIKFYVRVEMRKEETFDI